MPSIPANQPVTAIFARNYAAAASALLPKPYVAVIPHDSSWNDFGRYYGVRLLAFQSDSTTLEFEMHLMFEGAPYTATMIAQLTSVNRVVALQAVQQNFCSLLDDLDNYRQLIEGLGFELGVSILRGFGDAVVAEVEAVDPIRLSLVNSTDFHLGVLRSDKAFTAFRRAARYFTPFGSQSIDDAAASFAVDAKLPPAENNYQTKFDYSPDPLLRNRVSVLIGRNGSGKTQFLLNVIRGLRDATDPFSLHASFDPLPAYTRVLVFSSVASDPYPREIQPWEGLDYQYFSMTAHRAQDRDSLTTSLIDCLRDDGRIQFFPSAPFQPAGRFRLLERSLRPLGIWDWIFLRLKEAHEDLDAKQVEEQLYFPLSRAATMNEQRKLLLVQRVDWKASPVMIEPDSKTLRALSSGETAMLRFAAQAAANIETGCALLFDEPETHLHPKFISDFMDVLTALVTATKSIAIIATHSAYVVREVPRQRVKVFSLEERNVTIQTPRLQTFGASIDSISQFVFGDTDTTHRYQDILTQWVSSLPPGTTIEAVIAEYGALMNSETLSFVAQLLRERPQ